jgi:hypothetical protein
MARSLTASSLALFASFLPSLPPPQVLRPSSKVFKTTYKAVRPNVALY